MLVKSRHKDEFRPRLKERLKGTAEDWLPPIVTRTLA